MLNSCCLYQLLDQQSLLYHRQTLLYPDNDSYHWQTLLYHSQALLYRQALLNLT